MYEEINTEHDYEMSKNGYLIPWAEQGILLLDTAKGFFGCGHFKKANEILKKLGKEEINWKM